MICPNCGAQLPDTAKLCYSCRVTFNQGKMINPQSNAVMNLQSQNINPTNVYNPNTQQLSGNTSDNRQHVHNGRPEVSNTGNGLGAIWMIVIAVFVIIFLFVPLYWAINKSKNNDSDKKQSKSTSQTESITKEEKKTEQKTASTNSYKYKDYSIGSMKYKVYSKYSGDGTINEDGNAYFYYDDAMIMMSITDKPGDITDTEGQKQFVSSFKEGLENPSDFEIISDLKIDGYDAFGFSGYGILKNQEVALKVTVIEYNDTWYGICFKDSKDLKNIDDYSTVCNSIDFPDNSKSAKETKTAKEKTDSASKDKTTKIDKATNETAESKTSERKMGEVCIDKGVNIGLAHVKRSNSHVNSLGKTEEIGEGNEVVYLFFDIFNDTSKTQDVSYRDFSVYADGVAVKPVDSMWDYKVDGISSNMPSKLDPGTCNIILANYEVPKEWNELKVFYGSNFSWIVTSDEVTTDSYSNESLYDEEECLYFFEPGETVYSSKYEIVFDGFEIYTKNSILEGDIKYAVFKVTVNNTSASVIDYKYAGYRMRCYQNNYSTKDASFTLDDKIDDHINIFDIDEIQSGMSAKIYVAFELNGTSEDDYYKLMYDVGYMSDDLLTKICTK